MKYILMIMFVFFLTPAFAWDNSQYDSYGNKNYTHEGITGQRYKYNLKDPLDELDYRLDLDAQMMDRMNPNPLIDLDRRLGYYGGGAEW